VPRRNYTGYCSPEVDQMIDRQSSENRRRETQSG